MTLYKLIISLSYLSPLLLQFLLWPSIKNIIFFEQLPFYSLAYIGWIYYFFDEYYYDNAITNSNIYNFTLIMLITSLVTMIFTYIGFTVKFNFKLNLLNYVNRKTSSLFFHIRRIKNKMLVLSLIGIVLMIYSYSRMGFVPMFAPDPSSAKYFANEYQETYKPVAQYFRMGLNILNIVIYLQLLLLFKKNMKSKFLISLFFILSIILIISTFRRTYIGAAVLYMLMLFFIKYKNAKFLSLYFIMYFCIYSLGSAINGIFYYLIGFSDNVNFKEIFRGVPDVGDTICFWNSYINTHIGYAYGRLIYGALIPYHYYWNPGNFTKIVVGGTGYDASGGFRLPSAIWGYINFGWYGAVIWSMWFGFITGVKLRITKLIINNPSDSLTTLFFKLFVFQIVFTLISSLLNISIDTVFSFAVGIFCIYFIKLSEKDSFKRIEQSV